MQLFKYKFLWIPIVALAGYFALDKIFFLPQVKRYTVAWSNFEPENYHSRVDLYQQFVQEWKDRKQSGQRAALLLGTSRLMEFDTRAITSIRKDLYAYNFSAPAAGPSYSYYWIKKILEVVDSNHIAFVVMEFDPTILNRRNTGLALAYGYDPQFVWNNTELNQFKPKEIWDATGRGFAYDEAETYFVKQSFALSKYPLNFQNIVENNETILFTDPENGPTVLRKWQLKKRMVQQYRADLESNLGGRPLFQQPPLNDEQLEKHEELSIRVHLDYLRYAPSQMIFFKRALRTLAENNIAVLVYWPPSTAGIRNAMKDYGLFDEHRRGLAEYVKQLRKEYPDFRFSLVDPMEESDFACRRFFDSYHLLSACFPQVAQLMIDKWEAIPSSPGNQ